MSCVSNTDAIGANLLVGAVIATNLRERVADRRRGITRLERRQRTWIRNRSFVESLGLDPALVMGPAPWPAVVVEPDLAAERVLAGSGAATR